MGSSVDSREDMGGGNMDTRGSNGSGNVDSVVADGANTRDDTVAVVDSSDDSNGVGIRISLSPGSSHKQNLRMGMGEDIRRKLNDQHIQGGETFKGNWAMSVEKHWLKIMSSPRGYADADE